MQTYFLLGEPNVPENKKKDLAEKILKVMNNGGKREYQAAVELFRRLVNDEKNREIGSIIEYAGPNNWDIQDRRVTFNEARLKLRRYLSVMANKKLRAIYFGF